MFQAGVSAQSREFGAKYADVLFTSQPDLEHDRIFYAEAKAHAAKFGRNPDHLVVLPGLYAVVGDTEADARKRKAQFDEMLDLDFLVGNLAKQLGLPKSRNSIRTSRFRTSSSTRFRRRTRSSTIAAATSAGSRRRTTSRSNSWSTTTSTAASARSSARRSRSPTGSSSGSTPTSPTGSTSMSTFSPTASERFKRVITELQNRGRFRTEYEHPTFRANYGLPPG